MIQRYSRPEMRGIWTDENKLRLWLKIELFASEALVKEGVVPKKDFAKIKRDVIIVGVSNRMEIWSKESWQEFYKNTKDSFEKIKARMDALNKELNKLTK